MISKINTGSKIHHRLNHGMLGILLALLTISCNRRPVQNLDMYTGRYVRTSKAQSQYINITVEHEELVATSSWDAFKKTLGHLNSDKFIAKGFGWAFTFTRNKQKKVNGLMLLGTDYWQKAEKDQSVVTAAK